MAGITHSAFRRLIAGQGGCGALFTEMLPCRAVLVEDFATSPFIRRRPEEGNVVYQLLVSDVAVLGDAVASLAAASPFCIDVNLGCPAPAISRKGGGKALFDDLPRLGAALETIRSVWEGPLSVKCRLGHRTPDWKDRFAERLALFHDAGVDAICVHPRYFDEKLKRRARRELFPWIKERTSIPLIGNGDMTGVDALELLERGDCDGIMIGRAAVERPWIFRELRGEKVEIDYRRVWDDFFSYTLEDFSPERAICRIKEFTIHYARNFFFGHELFRKVQSAPDLGILRDRAHRFFDGNPRTVRR